MLPFLTLIFETEQNFWIYCIMLWTMGLLLVKVFLDSSTVGIDPGPLLFSIRILAVLTAPIWGPIIAILFVITFTYKILSE